MKITLVVAALMMLNFINQSTFEVSPEMGEIVVQGTSSVHDWESDVTDFKVTGELLENEIKNLEVVISVEGIESGKGIMDDKTYEALKSKKHPNIIFKSESLTVNQSTVEGAGDIIIGGATNSMPIQANIIAQSSVKMDLKGSVKIKMTDFGIDPPTAMFGSLTTGDEVTIQFNISIPK